ncbi:MAG: Mur ligase domain-containing protein, partial [Cytophagales bacterium]|nr:Mur ligase domain-containing protein [Cytophagales bacterium]
MKKLLKDFITANFIVEVVGDLERAVDDIETNSKLIEKENTLFVAIQGISVNGEDFIAEAIANGAIAILVTDTFNFEKYKNTQVTFV